MIYQFFPRSHGITSEIQAIVDCFETVNNNIDSEFYKYESPEVLEILRPHFESLSFSVETGKKVKDKIPVPVLFGVNNSIDRQFFADALSKDGRIVIEIEAGQAVDNNNYLKRIFQSCLMYDVEYLVLAVRIVYRKNKNFEKIYSFLETLYLSNRLQLPLKGILLLGY